MGRAAAADMVVQLTTNPNEADRRVGVVADQVLTVTAADAGKVVVVQGDGSLAVQAPAVTPAGAVPDLASDDAPTLYAEAEEQGWRDAVVGKVNALLAELRAAGVLTS